jgi:DNA primase
MTTGILTKPNLKRANQHRPCPICEGDGCGLGDGFTVCWRVGSNRQARSGAWIHTDENTSQRRYLPRPVYIPPPLAPIERRHAVYSALLDNLPLYNIHADQLANRRRLSDTTIAAEAFASVPAKAFAAPLVEKLAGEFDLSYVPGFFKGGGRWHLRFVGMSGFYIPIRDHRRRISALEIRRDTEDPKRRYLLLSSGGEGFPLGASSGAPPHLAKPHLVRDAIAITEGALKADVCAELLNQPICGLVAVGTFGDRFGWQLRTCFPKLQRAAIAYDMEENEKTEKQKERLRKSLESAGLEAVVFDWPKEMGKGFDDYLIHQQAQEEI